MLIGIIGAPNKGKSTFFKAATLAEVEIANRPFTTIKPNHAIGFVKIDCIDKEFNLKCNPNYGYCIKNRRFIPIDLLDVAGLIPGSHKGLGLGNKFLDDLRQADAFIHIIDISGSTNEKGENVEKLSYNPIKDIEFLEYEIDMWIYSLIKKNFDKFSKKIKQESLELHKTIAKQLSGLGVTEEISKEVIKEFNQDITKWNDNDIKRLSTLIRKKTKPMVIAANKIDIKGSDINLKKLKEKYPSYKIIPCSAEIELALKEAAKNNLIEYIPGESNFKIIGKLNEKQKNALEFIKEFFKRYNSTGIQEILDTIVFDTLNYIAVFPVENSSKLTDSKNKILPDCFLLKNGSTTIDLAYAVHTDIGKNFVKALNVKNKLIIGKEHKLKHLDIIEIKT